VADSIRLEWSQQLSNDRPQRWSWYVQRHLFLRRWPARFASIGRTYGIIYIIRSRDSLDWSYKLYGRQCHQWHRSNCM